MPRIKYHTVEEKIQAQKEARRRWSQKNKEKLRAKQKEYHSRPEVKQHYAELQRKWRENNPKRYKEIDRKSYHDTRKHNKASRLRSAAKERAILCQVPFDLEVTDIVIPTHCPVLGVELKSGNPDTRPELDRIVPERGYVKGNVCVISGRANRIKWNATLDELEAVAAYVRAKA